MSTRQKLKERILKIWQDPGQRWLFLGIIVASLILGYLMGGGSSAPPVKDLEHDHSHEQAAVTNLWTCSMHPQIKQSKPGNCPICGMELIPVSNKPVESGQGDIKLSPHAIKLAEIQTTEVKRRYVSSIIRLVGKIQYDETRLKYISAWIPGRLDRLYVNYTGIRVRKGNRLVSLYSPELISAQQELIEARRIGGSTLKVVKEKLRLWGLSQQQIQNLQKKNRIEDHLTIYSPISGIVIHKKAQEGMYVKTGTPIYTIVDLTKVWLILEAYETDLPWIRYGQTVEFETEAYPGETFKGTISFIDPVLNSKTRTVKIRVNVKNPNRKLKPEMFVRAIVRSRLSVSGKVMDPDLAGKWISPMHPEIVKDRPGKCDICGMPLVKAEKLGYITARDEDKEAPLVIPVSAPLITGTRAIVYIKVPEKEGVFSGIEVVLGPRAGDYYIVKKGLKQGDEVVVNGAFKIDSDLQIQAKPSMMSPEGGVAAPVHQHGSTPKPGNQEDPAKKQKHDSHETSKQKTSDIPILFKKSIDVVVGFYFDTQHALSSDELAKAKKSAEKLLKKLAQVDMSLLKGEVHMQWMKLESRIKESSQKLAKATDIEAARGQFELLTTAVTHTIKTFGSGEAAIYRFHCPMAFNNKGAFWLQKNSETRNPYFGNAMLTCKDSVEPLVPEKKTQK